MRLSFIRKSCTNSFYILVEVGYSINDDAQTLSDIQIFEKVYKIGQLPKVLLKKINFRQNKTKPCVTELRLRSTQVYHAFLTRAVC